MKKLKTVNGFNLSVHNIYEIENINLLGQMNIIHRRQVQKSDRINSDRQSGSDQLRLSRIMKNTIKLNEIEPFTHYFDGQNSGQKWAKLRKTRDGVSLCVIFSMTKSHQLCLLLQC